MCCLALLAWLRYRKNLTQLYVVHATLTFRALMNFATTFVSSKFFHKIEYIERSGGRGPD